MAKNRKKPQIVDRRVAGVHISGAGGRAAPMAHAVYQIWWSNGEVTFDRGQTLFGAAFQIDPKTGKIPKNNRGDLYTKMEAAALLMRDIEYECVVLDGHEKKLYK